jgi:hypothetical protein
VALDPAKVLEQIGIKGESLQKVRFSRGVVGKSSFVVVTALAVLAIVATRITGTEALLVIAGLTVVFALVFLVMSYRFAAANPSLALLEGAELLKWKQIEHQAAKGLPEPPKSLPVTDPSKPTPGLSSGKPEPDAESGADNK